MKQYLLLGVPDSPHHAHERPLGVHKPAQEYVDTEAGDEQEHDWEEQGEALEALQVRLHHHVPLVLVLGDDVLDSRVLHYLFNRGYLRFHIFGVVHPEQQLVVTVGQLGHLLYVPDGHPYDCHGGSRQYGAEVAFLAGKHQIFGVACYAYYLHRNLGAVPVVVDCVPGVNVVVAGEMRLGDTYHRVARLEVPSFLDDDVVDERLLVWKAGHPPHQVLATGHDERLVHLDPGGDHCYAGHLPGLFHNVFRDFIGCYPEVGEVQLLVGVLVRGVKVTVGH